MGLERTAFHRIVASCWPAGMVFGTGQLPSQLSSEQKRMNLHYVDRRHSAVYHRTYAERTSVLFLEKGVESVPDTGVCRYIVDIRLSYGMYRTQMGSAPRTNACRESNRSTLSETSLWR